MSVSFLDIFLYLGQAILALAVFVASLRILRGLSRPSISMEQPVTSSSSRMKASVH